MKSTFPDVAVADEPYYDTLLRAIWSHASETPDRPALIDEDLDNSSISYGQLYLEAHSIAAFLDGRHFGHGDIAAIVLSNCRQYASFFLGAILTGGAVSGASALFTDYELERQFVDSQCKAVLTSDRSIDRVLTATRNCPNIRTIIVIQTDGSAESQHSSTNLFDWSTVIATMPNFYRHRIDHDLSRDILLLPYSSGTTGSPKGVILTHRNTGTMHRIYKTHSDNYIMPYADRNWQYTKEYSLLFLPFYHIYGFMVMLNALVEGSTAVILSKFDANRFFATIEKYRIRRLPAVPPILVLLAKSPIADKYDLSCMEIVLTGAAPAGRDICEEVKEKYPNIKHIVQGYGMTECSMASHFPVLGVQEKFGSAGRLASNFEQKIVNVETGKECDLNERGELWVRGPTIMAGYLNRPQATAETIDDQGWLHTGDIVYVDGDGDLFIVDRLKELIKVRGLQVPPAELEDLLLSHPEIRDAAVVGVPDEKAGELPKAYVVRANDKLTETDVVEFVKNKVAHYKQLKGGVEFIDEIPKSASGKILRRFLRDRSAQQMQQNAASKL